MKEEKFVQAQYIDLPAPRRGLEPADLNRVWHLTHDYPQRVCQAAEKELKGQW